MRQEDKFMTDEQKDAGIIICEYIRKKAAECRDLGMKYSKIELDMQYYDFCITVSGDLIKLHNDIQNEQFKPEFEAYNFFCAYVFGFFNYIVNTPELKRDKINMAQYNLLVSALEKYKDIIHLLENRRYEAAFILFRAFYENLIISSFLNYNDCETELYDFSFYKLFRNFPEINNEDISKRLTEIKNKYSVKDLESNYGWARKFINKNADKKIYFTDILDCIIGNNMQLKDMYEKSSFLVHSNNVLLTDHRHEDVIKMQVCYYIEKIGISLLTKCFYDLFMEKNFGDANLFLKICENAMNVYKIKIWGIR
jgi:hypothetical protein